MEVVLDMIMLPKKSSGDPVADISKLLGKKVIRDTRQGEDPVVIINIENGTPKDIAKLKKAGFTIEQIR